MKFCWLFLIAAPFLTAQTTSPLAPKLISEGRIAFQNRCAGCHGSEAEGSDRAPQLAGSRRLRTRSMKQLRSLIYDGVPSAGMPAFHLSAEELDRLTAFVQSLNTTASETPIDGAPEEGERFFFNQGGCISCHMVRGRGSAVGPDLSNIAREMTIGELREVLLHPDKHVTPGYELVNVRLRNGKTLRGFRRGQSNFDIQIQNLNGQFHLLRQPEIASIEQEPGSLMQPLRVSAEQTQTLIAYLATLKGIEAKGAESHTSGSPAASLASSDSPEIDFARIRDPHPGDWLTYNGRLSGNRWSDLKQIDADNVRSLTVKWMFPIDHFGVETTPIVADGIMYVTGPNQAWALDAQTGRSIWHYARPRTQGLVGDASVGTNRGAAILGDKIFMVMDYAHLIALNRTTGALVWDAVMPEEPQHYGSTVAPLVVNDTVIAGVSGGDWGIRGFVACFKAATGELLWRRWTIPLHGEPGSETWKGSEPLYGGGSTWLTGAYDPETETLYWPTGNPWPDSDDRDRPGDNLYTNCILALNARTGELRWHYQFTPHDTHDWDATEPPVLVDTDYHGKPRKLLLHADRNGFFYVFDRINGELLLSKRFAQNLNWAEGIGPDGRPRLSAANAPMTCPSDATNWGSTSFSPITHLYYVLTLEQCRANRQPGSWKATLPNPQKFLRAINIETGEIAWEVPQIGMVQPKTWPGTLATASGLLFYADPNGAFIAADQRNGKSLWHFATNVPMKASPMTFMVEGKQYLAIAAGPNILCFGLP